MYITLFTIGKLKDHFFREMQVHFEKLLTSFCILTIKELQDEPLVKGIHSESVKQKEGKRIIKELSPQKIVVAFDAKGKQMTSAQFSVWLKKHKDQGNHLQCVIGGPYGISEEVKQKAQEVISLSNLTFPHQLARIILLEQLYRAYTIIQGKKYHY